MKEKTVEVVLEAFGNSSLKKQYTSDELRGKNVEQIVREMVSQEWRGEDSMTLQTISDQMRASNGYITRVGMQNPSQPVRFQPVGRGDQASGYVKDNRLRINITGDHVVGQYGDAPSDCR